MIEIIPYDKNWPLLFDEWANKIIRILRDNFVEIFHVGSTAVPELDGKDKIDIALQVRDAKHAINTLKKLNFEYKGEWNIPFKYGFIYREKIKINLHMFDYFHPSIKSQLLFRDILRKDKILCQEYAKLKYDIIKNPASHKKNHPFLYNYTLEKSNFIKNILKIAGFNEIYIQYPSDKEEIDYISNNDPNFPNIIENNKYFICYKGVEIIGFSQIQISYTKSKIIIKNLFLNKESKIYQSDLIKIIENYKKYI